MAPLTPENLAITAHVVAGDVSLREWRDPQDQDPDGMRDQEAVYKYIETASDEAFGIYIHIRQDLEPKPYDAVGVRVALDGIIVAENTESLATHC